MDSKEWLITEGYFDRSKVYYMCKCKCKCKQNSAHAETMC